MKQASLHLVLRLAAATDHALLVVVFCYWQVPLLGWPLAIGALLPLLLPAVGMWRGSLYAFKWLSLLITPYLAWGLMEAVANPQLRIQTSLFLALCFAFFCTVLAFVRATRRQELLRPRR